MRSSLPLKKERSHWKRVCIRITNTVVIHVLDSGMGIPSSDLPRIFERFYQVDKTRSREPEGTGLGLAIVKHIVEAHRGRVEVKSTLGQGSDFYFSLPLG